MVRGGVLVTVSRAGRLVCAMKIKTNVKAGGNRLYIGNLS
jgi:hypothetical protein